MINLLSSFFLFSQVDYTNSLAALSDLLNSSVSLSGIVYVTCITILLLRAVITA